MASDRVIDGVLLSDVQLSLPLFPAAVTTDRIEFVRHRRARRYILRVLHDGTLRVTLPRWGAKREAQAFIEASAQWIARQRELRRRTPSPEPPVWRTGTRILVDGREAVLRVERLADGCRITCDEEVVCEGQTNSMDVRAEVDAWLRRKAARSLPAQLLALAAAQGVNVARVSVRNQRSRWGACSPAGTITLNWRLVQTPPFVREYVLIHELMHRLELNHSRRFWRLVQARCPRHVEARRWLRRIGKTLWPDSREES